MKRAGSMDPDPYHYVMDPEHTGRDPVPKNTIFFVASCQGHQTRESYKQKSPM